MPKSTTGKKIPQAYISTMPPHSSPKKEVAIKTNIPHALLKIEICHFSLGVIEVIHTYTPSLCTVALQS